MACQQITARMRPYPIWRNLVLVGKIDMDAFHKCIYLSKFLLARRRTFRHQRGLLSHEHLSEDEWVSLSESAKKEIVRYAFEKTHFYASLYASAGFELGDMAQEGWFEKLPILTKAHLRKSLEEITATDLRTFRNVSTTGGSTGVPTKSGYDRRLPLEAYSWRLQSWYGVHPWDDHAYVWRDTRVSKLAKIRNALLWWPTKHLKLDASIMTEESIRNFLDAFNRLRPSLLQGYVGAVSHLASFIESEGLNVWSPKCVWVTSAPLSAVQRGLLERVFKAPVCDQYGSCEISWIAQQCPESHGLHVNAERVFLEFVNEVNHAVPRGEYGKTLITNLEDRVFPMIRYENGDRGRWLNETCPCGRTLPLIDSVKGRESESFVLPSGRIVNGEYLTTIFDGAPGLVSGFRCVQHKDLSITVEYVPAGSEADIRKVLDDFALKLGSEVPVSFQRVDAIAHDRGKIRFVVREK